MSLKLLVDLIDVIKETHYNFKKTTLSIVSRKRITAGIQQLECNEIYSRHWWRSRRLRIVGPWS